MDLVHVLVQKGLVKEDDVIAIQQEAVETGSTVEQVLLKRGISPQDILAAQGEYLDVPTRSLEGVEIPGKVLEYIPEESASHYQFLPIGVSDGVLEVGMVNPDDMEARDALNFISAKLEMPFKIFLITESDFNKVIASYRGLTGEVSKALTDLESELKIETSKVADDADKGGSGIGSESSDNPETD
ncbi:MAG: type pilus assembly protein PilB, partial [Patescibacteria group bacterium]|nr:type pilus assembly protein PilB [Patescibacteria group bacterium]